MLSLLIILGIVVSIVGCIVAVYMISNDKKSNETDKEKKKDYFDN